MLLFIHQFIINNVQGKFPTFTVSIQFFPTLSILYIILGATKTREQVGLDTKYNLFYFIFTTTQAWCSGKQKVAV